MKLSENIHAVAVGLLVALAPCWSTGCNEEETVDAPQFTATAPGGVFKVGEPVTFRFEGDPDFITFYSGEAGNAYDYRNRDRIEPAEVTLSFLENTRAGRAAAGVLVGFGGLSVHCQTLSVLAGTDLDVRRHLAGKVLQGALSGLLAWLLL